MADKDKFVKLPPEVDDPMNAFIANEAKFYAELAKSVESVNRIMYGVAGESANKNVTHVSRQDYKNFFGMDDKMIDAWVKYATDVLGREELVRGMDKIKGSWLGKKKGNSTVADARISADEKLKNQSPTQP